jgi:hypothetical protein
MSSGQSGQGASPVDNMTYNLIASLHSKLEGLSAYAKYMQDAQGDQEVQQLYQQLQQDDQQHVQRLQQALAKRLGGGGQ